MPGFDLRLEMERGIQNIWKNWIYGVPTKQKRRYSEAHSTSGPSTFQGYK